MAVTAGRGSRALGGWLLLGLLVAAGPGGAGILLAEGSGVGPGGGDELPAEEPVAGALPLPATLADPPFEPAPRLLLAGIPGVLYVLDAGPDLAPTGMRFARYASATGWTALAEPPPLGTADLSMAGDVPVLTGIACRDEEGRCDGPLVTTTFDAGADRWEDLVELRRQPREEFEARGQVRPREGAVVFVMDGELIVREPGRPVRRLPLPGLFPASPCVTADALTVLSVALEPGVLGPGVLGPGSSEEIDQEDQLRLEAAWNAGRYQVHHVDVEAATVGLASAETPVGLVSPQHRRGVTPICLVDGVLVLGDAAGAVWRPGERRWSAFDANAIAGTQVSDQITLDDGRTILLVKHSPGVESIVTISPAGAVTGVEALPTDLDGPLMSRQLVAVGSHALLYQHVGYDPPRTSFVTVAGT